MQPERDPFVNVVQYLERPLLSGYISKKNLEILQNSAVVCANRLGEGVVIRMVDNPNFRGVWYGTNKLFANALFFGGAIKQTSAVE